MCITWKRFSINLLGGISRGHLLQFKKLCATLAGREEKWLYFFREPQSHDVRRWRQKHESRLKRDKEICCCGEGRAVQRLLNREPKKTNHFYGSSKDKHLTCFALDGTPQTLKVSSLPETKVSPPPTTTNHPFTPTCITDTPISIYTIKEQKIV